MDDLTEVEDLRGEVAALRAEVDRLRALLNPPTGGGVYYPPQNMWISPQNAWGANAGAGTFAGQVYTVDASEPLKIENWQYNTGCAAPPPTITFNWPG